MRKERTGLSVARRASEFVVVGAFALAGCRPRDPSDARVASPVVSANPTAAPAAADPPAESARGDDVAGAGEGMSRPVRIGGRELALTAEAQQACALGPMEVRYTVMADGTVGECQVPKGTPLLEAEVCDAVKSWRYKPAIWQGRPMTLPMVLIVRFGACKPSSPSP